MEISPLFPHGLLRVLVASWDLENVTYSLLVMWKRSEDCEAHGHKAGRNGKLQLRRQTAVSGEVRAIRGSDFCFDFGSAGAGKRKYQIENVCHI